MEVLYISYDGLSDPLGRSQIMPYLLGLSKEGHKFHVISCEKQDALKSSGDQVKEILKSASINWLPLPYTKRPPVISTWKDIRAMRKAINDIISKGNIQAIHCRSYISMIAAFPVSKKLKIPIIFDMRGFWADERIEGKIWNRNNLLFSSLYKYFKKQEFKWFREATQVVSLTENGRNYIAKHFDIPKEKMEVIPCCADQHFFDPSKVSAANLSNFYESYPETRDSKILGYVGSIGTWYMLDEMLEQFGRLKKAEVVDKFLFITRENPDFILRKAEEKNVQKEDVIVVSSSRDEMPTLLSLIDVGIFYIRPTFSKIASSPTKLAEMLCMGIPVICNNSVGDLDDFFKENKIGVCHSIDNLEEILPDDVRDLLKIEGSVIRETGIKYFSLDKGIQSYQRLYSRILS